MTIIKDGPGPGGCRQTTHRFENGYGASVILGGEYARGGLELAVAEFHSDNDNDWTLCYGTPVTDDVLGYLNDESLAEHLAAIEALPAPGRQPMRDHRFHVTNAKWYVIRNDLIGGFAVSHINKDLSQHDHNNGEGEIADFSSKAVAEHVVSLHNSWVESL